LAADRITGMAGRTTATVDLKAGSR
jgi:hypothetical protein